MSMHTIKRTRKQSDKASVVKAQAKRENPVLGRKATLGNSLRPISEVKTEIAEYQAKKAERAEREYRASKYQANVERNKIRTKVR